MRRIAVCALASAVLTACASTVSGHGSGAGSSAPSAVTSSLPSSGGFRPPSSPAPGSSSLPGSGPRSSPPVAHPISRVTVTGSTTGTAYQVDIWAVDRITDCAAHAYGSALVAFLRAHPCHSATRRLLTLDLDGREVALSSVAVTLPPYGSGTSGDVYRYAGEFVRLENANGTGSMDDLLREGVRVPGVQSAIPADEAFLVQGEDLGVAVFDAWYVHGPTPSQAVELVRLERDLTLTPISVDQ